MLQDFFNAMSQGAETATHTVGGFLSDMVNGSKMTYDAAQYKQEHPVAPVATPAAVDPNKILETVRYMETRGQKDPYGFSQPSGVKALGDALGAYQITEAKLREQSKSLGYDKPLTKEQFLADPNLQDEFMGRLVKKFGDQFKFDPQTMFAAHRGGFSHLDQMAGVIESHKQYVDEATNKYNSL